MRTSIPRILPAIGAAAGLGLSACGDRNHQALERDHAVTTQGAAEAVATDLMEDLEEATAVAEREAREGAEDAGQELEQAGQSLRQMGPEESASR